MEPRRKFAASLSPHLRCELNDLHRGRTNAEGASMNSRLQALITKSCGYHNRERFQQDACFHFGNLDLFPGPVAW
jgi:hypothetical protein